MTQAENVVQFPDSRGQAVPQVEDGYTRIANELLEAIAGGGFSKREFAVLLAILRKTYGYGKKADDIAVSQLAAITNIHANHVAKALRDLAARNIITREKGRHGFILGLNKRYREWQNNQNGCGTTKTVVRQPQVVEKQENNQNGCGEPNNQNGCEGQPKRSPQKKTPKETKTPHKPPRGPVLPDWLSPEAWADFVEFRKKAKAPLTDRAAELAVKKLEALRSGGNDPRAVIEQSILHGWKGLFPLKGDDKPRGSQPTGAKSMAERRTF